MNVRRSVRTVGPFERMEDFVPAAKKSGTLIGATGANDRLFVDLYYDMKRRNGYSQEEIDRKRFSLEGVLVPVTAKWNEDLLHEAGFTRVENFWRWMNFGARLGVKPS